MLLVASVLLCAQTVFGLTLTSTLSGSVNAYDRPFDWSPGGNRILTGMKSAHANAPEDRLWRFYTSQVDGLACVGGAWTGHANSFDAVLNFNCPTGQAIAGISSYHDNNREDRRWRFRCCNISGRFKIVSATMTNYVNDWDAALDYKCPNSVMVGLYSVHDNNREDRRWKVKCGRIVKVATGQPTVAPTNPPSAVPSTEAPTAPPTEAPTASPTTEPTPSPTTLPTVSPTEMPSEVPTASPTQMPTPSPTETSTGMVLEEMMGLKTAVLGELSKVLSEVMALKTEMADVKMQVNSLQQKCTADDECERERPCNKNKGAKKCRAASGCVWDKESDPPMCTEK